jgi:hypothetical protein
LVAIVIDFHTHLVQVEELLERGPRGAVHQVFGVTMRPQPPETFIAHMDEAAVAWAVILTLDSATSACA